MMTTNLSALKKRRTILRNRIKADVLALVEMSEGELSVFEATHALLDTLIHEVDNTAVTYGKPATLDVGLAQTYLPSTLALVEGQAQDNGGPVKKIKNALSSIIDPAAVKAYKMSNYQIQGKAASLLMVDDLPSAYPKGPETVFAKITKNLDKWEYAQPMVWMQGGKNMIVGGTVAVKTIEEYGYELPEGYAFQPLPWKSEVTIVKLETESAKPGSKPVHFCGSKGCLDLKVPYVGGLQITGAEAASKGLNYTKMLDQYPAEAGMGVHISKSPIMDLIYVKVFDPASTDLDAHLKTDLDAHLKTYMQDSIKAGLSAPSPFAAAFDPQPPWEKHAPDLFPIQVKDGTVVQVPFKKWLPESYLQETGLWSMCLPNGIMWHNSPTKSDGTAEWMLDYAGSKPPVWDNF